MKKSTQQLYTERILRVLVFIQRNLDDELLPEEYARVDLIGLNVKADNAPALACYSRLGFEIVAPYAEFTIEKV